MDCRFVSVDIETTGLDEKTCQVIEVGAVIDDWLTPLENPPKFHCYVVHPVYQGEPYALSMHPEIFRRIAERDEDKYLFLRPEWVRAHLHNFLIPYFGNRGPYNVAGKNYAGFDDRFLRCLPGWDVEKVFRRRVIDPGELYWNPLKDSELPNTEECMKRAGLEGVVAHTALEDAKVVARLIQIAVARR